MNYASINDAYGVESFNLNNKKKKKREINDIQYDNENIKPNYNNIEEYKKEFTEHCEPLQPPHYKLPISDKVMQNYNNAYQVFLKDRKINQLNQKNDINTTLNVPASNKNNKHSINIYDNYNKIKLEDIKEIEPYYDEDLDNYLNINEFNNIDYDTNINNDEKNELMKKNYNLKTQEPLKFNSDDYVLIPKKKLKSLSKFKKNNNRYVQNLNTNNINDINIDTDTDSDTDTDTDIDENIDILDKNIYQKPVIENFKTYKKKHKEGFKNNNSSILQGYNENIVKKKNPINDFYKNIINIGLFILIGVFIIFLLDLLTELALHKGMKQTVEVLIPLLEELKSLKDKK